MPKSCRFLDIHHVLCGVTGSAHALLPAHGGLYCGRAADAGQQEVQAHGNAEGRRQVQGRQVGLKGHGGDPNLLKERCDAAELHATELDVRTLSAIFTDVIEQVASLDCSRNGCLS